MAMTAKPVFCVLEHFTSSLHSDAQVSEGFDAFNIVCAMDTAFVF
jgi:hypothetical protein